jgi:dihydroorotase
LPVPSLQENSEANFTIFDSEVEWELNRDDIQSKSLNTPFLNKILKGKAIAIFNHGKLLKQ